MATGLEANRRGELDHLLQRSRCSGARPWSRKPRIEENRQILLVLLLELLEPSARRAGPRFASESNAGYRRAGSRRPVDPLVAGPSGRASAPMSPTPCRWRNCQRRVELANFRIDGQLGRFERGDPAADQPERRPSDQVEHSEPVLSRFGQRLPTEPRRVIPGTRARPARGGRCLLLRRSGQGGRDRPRRPAPEAAIQRREFSKTCSGA